MSGTGKDKMKLAADLVRKGGAILAEPCQQCGGIQVRYRGKVYCTGHEDLSGILKSGEVSYDTVMAQTREVLVAKLSDAAALLEGEKDPAAQDRIVTLMGKYFELLQKLPK